MDINFKSRAELKGYFVRNAIPTESNFRDLIEAGLNQKDDGITKAPKDALNLEAADDPEKKAINFYASFADKQPAWVLSLLPGAMLGDLANPRRGFGIRDGSGASRLFIDGATGSVGIGTTDPQKPLDVSGEAQAKGLTVNGTSNLNGAVTVTSPTAKNSPRQVHIKGNCAAPGAFDTLDRPALAISGEFPEITLFSESLSQTHGPSIRLGSYTDSEKKTLQHWVLGTGAIGGRQLDIGFATGNSNPHAGVNNYPDANTGKTILRLTSDGKVGIGTLSPAKQLDVVGEAQATGLTVTGAANLNGAVNISAQSTLTAAGPVLAKAGATVSGGPLVTEKVGIGTPTPTRQLHIKGNCVGPDVFDAADRPCLAISGDYPEVTLFSEAEGGAYGPTIRLGTYTDATKAVLQHWVVGTGSIGGNQLDIGFATGNGNPHAGVNNYPDGITGKTVMRLTGDGKVGIGTLSPAKQLDVSGEVQAKGLTVNGAASLNGNVSVTGASSLNGGVSVTGASSLNGAVTVTGAASLNGGVSVTGAASLNGDVNISAKSTLAAAGPVRAQAGATVSGGPLVTEKVGIGTPTPKRQLHIKGNCVGPDVFDTLDRPALAISGEFPELTLFSESVSKTHGPSIRLGSYTDAQKNVYQHWVVGTGSIGGNQLDIGFAKGHSNPHAGINNYNEDSNTKTGKTVMRLTGDGKVGIGTLNPDKQLDVVGEVQAKGLTVNGASTLAGAVTVTGAASLNGGVSVTGASALNGAVTVTGAASLNGGVSVTGASALNGAVTVTGAANLNGGVSVTGASALNGAVTVTGAASLNGGVSVTEVQAKGLTVNGASSLNGAVTLTGAASLNGGVSVTGASSLNGAVTVSGASSLNGGVTVSGASSLNGGVSVTGASSLNGTVTVTSPTVKDNPRQVYIKGNCAAPGAFDTLDRPALAISGEYPEITLFSESASKTHGPSIRLGSYTDAQKNVYQHWVVGTGSIGGNQLDIGFAKGHSNPHAGISNYNEDSNTKTGKTVMRLTGDGKVGIGTLNPDKQLNVVGEVQATGLTVKGTSTLAGAVTVTGAASLNGAATVTGAASLNGGVSVTGASSLNGAVTVSGASSLNGAVTVSGASSLNGGVSVTGASSLNGTVTVTSPTVKDNPRQVYIKGNCAAPGAFDTFDRPALAISGEYPEITLFSESVSKTHGPSIRLGSYTDAQKNVYQHWVVGTGSIGGNQLDIGFAKGHSNPHAGIDNYNGDSNTKTGKTVMRLTGEGKVGIGTLSPTKQLEVVGEVQATGLTVKGETPAEIKLLPHDASLDNMANGPTIQLTSSDLNGAFWKIRNDVSSAELQFIVGWPRREEEVVATLTKSGDWIPVSSHPRNSSDRTLKDSIEELNGVLGQVMRLKPVRFTWKSNQQRDIGFIAQDVEPLFPEIVGSRQETQAGGESRSLKTLEYNGFGAIAVAAIQELAQSVNQRLAALAAENQELKARLAALESRLR